MSILELVRIKILFRAEIVSANLLKTNLIYINHEINNQPKKKGLSDSWWNCHSPALDVAFVVNTKQINGIVEGRRVVTGVDSNGKSILVSDGFVADSARWSEPNVKRSGSDLWMGY